MKDTDRKLGDLVEGCRKVMGDHLEGIILYGSAATGEYIERYSDLNTVIIVKVIDQVSLTKLAPLVGRWCRDGNPPPLLMTADEIRRSTDVFPMEFLDIQASHRVLYGEDPFRDLQVDRRNLRHECEHELKGKIIRLREQYLLARGSDARVRDLLVHSLSTFVALFRGTLRLLIDDVPMAHRDVIRRISGLVGVDLAVMEKILDLKEGRVEIRGDDLRTLFGEYLEGIEKVADQVDLYLTKNN